MIIIIIKRLRKAKEVLMPVCTPCEPTRRSSRLTNITLWRCYAYRPLAAERAQIFEFAVKITHLSQPYQDKALIRRRWRNFLLN